MTPYYTDPAVPAVRTQGTETEGVDMTQFVCFRIDPQGADYLGTIEAESLSEAEDAAARMWTTHAGEWLDVEYDNEAEDRT